MDFDMGKYGFYVWGAYGLSALSLGALVLISLRAQGQQKKALEALNAATEKPTPPVISPAPEIPEPQNRVANQGNAQ
jgi:heme exporter protein CcmD